MWNVFSTDYTVFESMYICMFADCKKWIMIVYTLCSFPLMSSTVSSSLVMVQFVSNKKKY